MNRETKIGIVQYIAQSEAKGVKFTDDPQVWYNPTEEAKAQVLQEYKGKTVEIVLVPGKAGQFSSMTLIDSDQVKSEAEEEEVIDEPGQAKPARPVAQEQHRPETEIQAPLAKQALKKEVTSSNVLEKEPRLDSVWPAYTREAYSELEKVQLDTVKKGTGSYQLTYASWSECWSKLKQRHPTAQYTVYTNDAGMPYFYDRTGAFVKVGVTVMGLEHVTFLPVMDHANRSIKVESMTTFDINKSVQRALAKAISMHGLGLYLYKGEDLPEK